MVIGICQLVLYLPDSASLKNKRSVIQSLTVRIRNKFNVSISEVAENELWQKAVLAVAIVSNDSRYANKVLSKIIDLVQTDLGVELIDYSVEMI